jgi:threonine synthase
LREEADIVSLVKRVAPLARASHRGHRFGFENLFIKVAGIIPTGTFKTRGSAVGGLRPEGHCDR